MCNVNNVAKHGKHSILNDRDGIVVVIAILYCRRWSWSSTSASTSWAHQVSPKVIVFIVYFGAVGMTNTRAQSVVDLLYTNIYTWLNLNLFAECVCAMHKFMGNSIDRDTQQPNRYVYGMRCRRASCDFIHF